MLRRGWMPCHPPVADRGLVPELAVPFGYLLAARTVVSAILNVRRVPSPLPLLRATVMSGYRLVRKFALFLPPRGVMRWLGGHRRAARIRA